MQPLSYVVHFILIWGILCASESCDHLGMVFYEDIGCTPEFDEPKACPIRYKCPNFETIPDKCQFRGKTFKIDESLDGNLTYPNCNIGCFCREGGTFTCAVLDCPEYLGAPVGPGCYRTYKLDECCAAGDTCPPFDNLEKCVVDGKEYREGQKFYPQNTCFKCICQKGFKGKFEEPFCEKMTCGTQVNDRDNSLSKACGPYFGKKEENKAICCPHSWICPSGNEEIKGEAKSEEVCKLGSKSLKVGQFVEKPEYTLSYGQTVKNVRCECIIPPLVHCTGSD